MEAVKTKPAINSNLSDEELGVIAAERRKQREDACTREYNEAVERILIKHRCRLRVGLTFWNDGEGQSVIQIVAVE